MSIKKSDAIISDLRINCEHDAANLIEQLQQRVGELESYLEGLAQYLIENDYDRSDENIDRWIEKSPQTSLAEHDADLIRDFTNSLLNGCNKGLDGRFLWHEQVGEIMGDYIAKIRNGKDGE